MIPRLVCRLALRFGCCAGVVGLWWLLAGCCLAQEITSEADALARLERLEREIEALRSEVAARPESACPESPTREGEKPIPKEDVIKQIDQRIASERWRHKGIIVRPYGMFWTSLVGSSSRFTPSDAALYMLPGEANGADLCTISARRSRVGLAIEDAHVDWFGGMEMSGKVEIDFMGELGTAENKPSVLLREVYWEAKNDCFHFLIGQTKDVVSPLEPGMLNYYNLWCAGNVGYRNPQLRFERFVYWNCRTRMEIAASLSQLTGADFSSVDFSGSYPVVQARVGWTIARDTCRFPVQFGFSGHIGEQRYDFPSEELAIDTWSINFDFSVPLSDRCGIRGEIFHGQGLAGIYGGIEQSVDYSLTSGGSGRSIHSTGGWLEFWWDWTSKLRYCVGFGTDDPHDNDLETAQRRKNSVIYTNFTYEFTPFLRTGVEYAYWKTEYQIDTPGGEKGCANVIEWMWQFEF
ncbi:MAG: hypothetical protein Q4D38_06320 [Planctomycetia bacterium]|nr:hypothetical protein [Planctomycetia bacterium]